MHLFCYSLIRTWNPSKQRLLWQRCIAFNLGRPQGSRWEWWRQCECFASCCRTSKCKSWLWGKMQNRDYINVCENHDVGCWLCAERRTCLANVWLCAVSDICRQADCRPQTADHRLLMADCRVHTISKSLHRTFSTIFQPCLTFADCRPQSADGRLQSTHRFKVFTQNLFNCFSAVSDICRLQTTNCWWETAEFVPQTAETKESQNGFFFHDIPVNV